MTYREPRMATARSTTVECLLVEDVQGFVEVAPMVDGCFEHLDSAGEFFNVFV